MSQGLHWRGLHALLESNCRKESINGLKSNHPESYEHLKSVCLDNENYLLLSALEDKSDNIDKLFFVFLNKKFHPIVFSKQEKYSYEQCCHVCNFAGINHSQIEAYITVKPL